MIFRIHRKKLSAKQNERDAVKVITRDGCSIITATPRHGILGAVVSDVGCLRSNNEDNYVLGESMNANASDHSEDSLTVTKTMGTWQLAGVFDGMGGGEMGELASGDTARIFRDTFASLNGSAGKDWIDQCIRIAFLKANNAIVDLQKEYKVFGTTGTVICTNGAEFKIYHLGDSRAYLVRDNRLQQLTKDQTLAQMKIDVGMYREDDPAAEVDKHKLTEYIGRDRTKENIKPVESRWIPVQSEDVVLLCSDGLYDMCADGEISRILQDSGSPSEKAADLVQNAISKGGEDNVTCVVITFN